MLPLEPHEGSMEEKGAPLAHLSRRTIAAVLAGLGDRVGPRARRAPGRAGGDARGAGTTDRAALRFAHLGPRRIPYVLGDVPEQEGSPRSPCRWWCGHQGLHDRKAGPAELKERPCATRVTRSCLRHWACGSRPRRTTSSSPWAAARSRSRRAPSPRQADPQATPKRPPRDPRPPPLPLQDDQDARQSRRRRRRSDLGRRPARKWTRWTGRLGPGASPAPSCSPSEIGQAAVTGAGGSTDRRAAGTGGTGGGGDGGCRAASAARGASRDAGARAAVGRFSRRGRHHAHGVPRFGKRRRDEEPTAPDDVLSPGGRGVASPATPVSSPARRRRPPSRGAGHRRPLVAAPPVGDVDAHMPRWRRPSSRRRARPTRCGPCRPASG